MNCRHCKEVLNYTFLDLGFAPPSNAYLQKDDLNKHEVYLPLKVKVCEKCGGEECICDYIEEKEVNSEVKEAEQKSAASIMEYLLPKDRSMKT